MTTQDIAKQRLYAHHLRQLRCRQPAETVAWLGAVQAQDYAGAKWSVAQRLPAATDATMEHAFADGAILRTHVLRPTWHFVAAADIRWLLALTAPRVHALNAPYYRKAGLDTATLNRSNDILAQALQGGQQRTREELAVALQQGGIATEGEARLISLVMYAELEGVIASGARRGKQFTYALLDERVPPTRPLTREEALAAAVTRYFASHGPAMIADFVWWSGLTVADANAGIALVGEALAQTILEGKRYYHAPRVMTPTSNGPHAWLLPTYDEYLLSYVDRSASLDPQVGHIWNGSHEPFTSSIVLDGQVVGVWRRSFKRKQAVIETRYYRLLTKDEEQAVADAMQRFGQFLGMPVSITPTASLAPD
jgi:Winged helix DNA-binding domain